MFRVFRFWLYGKVTLLDQFRPLTPLDYSLAIPKVFKLVDGVGCVSMTNQKHKLRVRRDLNLTNNWQK